MAGAGSRLGRIGCSIISISTGVSFAAVNRRIIITGTAVNNSFPADYHFIVAGLCRCPGRIDCAIISISAGVSFAAVQTASLCAAADGYRIMAGAGSCVRGSISSAPGAGSGSISVRVILTAVNAAADHGIPADSYRVVAGLCRCPRRMVCARSIVSIRVCVSITAINSTANSSFAADGHFIPAGSSLGRTCCAIISVNRSRTADNTVCDRNLFAAVFADSYYIFTGSSFGSNCCNPRDTIIPCQRNGTVTAVNCSLHRRCALDGYRIIVGGGRCPDISCGPVIVRVNVIRLIVIVTAVNGPNSSSVDSNLIIIGSGC